MATPIPETEYKPHKYVFGRPRIHDRDKIAEELIEWANKPESINLNKFCAVAAISPRYLSQWADECPHFREAYEYAKTFIGARREEMLNVDLLHVKAYDLNAKTYDYFLDEKYQKNAQFESSLRKDEDSSNSKQPIHVNVTSALGSGINVPTPFISNTDNNSPK
jgi:hypothetical protein